MAAPGQGVAGMNVDKVVELDMLTQSEIADKIAHGWTSAFLPAGGTEIRGPHAIIGVHTILAHNRAVEAAKRLGNTIVAPTIPYAVAATGGANANNWQKYMADGTTAPDVGAIQVSSETFKGIVQGGVESLAYMGFKNIFLMGDHGGGQQEMKAVADDMTEKLSTRGVKVHVIGDFYQKTHDDIDMYMYNHRLPIAGHGGMMETAEMMYWEPTQFAYVRPNFKTVPYSGNSDDIDGWKAQKDAQAAGRGRGAGGGGGRGAGGNAAAGAGGGAGRGAGGGGGQRGPTVYPTGNPHPSTKAIGKDLAEIGINNTVNQVKAVLAGRAANN
jgi:creatinine amidohydrolase/Fe(II)-dependent formamide hydrolase-like protein